MRGEGEGADPYLRVPAPSTRPPPQARPPAYSTQPPHRPARRPIPPPPPPPKPPKPHNTHQHTPIHTQHGERRTLTSQSCTSRSASSAARARRRLSKKGAGLYGVWPRRATGEGSAWSVPRVSVWNLCGCAWCHCTRQPVSRRSDWDEGSEGRREGRKEGGRGRGRGGRGIRTLSAPFASIQLSVSASAAHSSTPQYCV